MDSTDSTFHVALDSLASLADAIKIETTLDEYRPSHAQVTALANKVVMGASLLVNPENSREISQQDVIQLASYQVYSLGSAPFQLATFRWTRKNSIRAALQSTIREFREGRLAVSFLIARSIIETVGGLALVHSDISKTTLLETDVVKLAKNVAEVDASISQRAKGMKVDWADMFQKGLRTGKSKSYKPQEDGLDYLARDLMNGVDLIDKKVKGGRKTYDFLSEFAHPNIGPYMLGIETTSYSRTSRGLDLTKKVYKMNVHGAVSVNQFSSLISEFLDVLSEIVRFAIELDEELTRSQLQLQSAVKTIIRRALKVNPESLQIADVCPCFSGRIVSACCGRLIRLGQVSKRAGRSNV